MMDELDEGIRQELVLRQALNLLIENVSNKEEKPNGAVDFIVEQYREALECFPDMFQSLAAKAKNDLASSSALMSKLNLNGNPPQDIFERLAKNQQKKLVKQLRAFKHTYLKKKAESEKKAAMREKNQAENVKREEDKENDNGNDKRRDRKKMEGEDERERKRRKHDTSGASRMSHVGSLYVCMCVCMYVYVCVCVCER
eukprot:Rmarinus@m.2591